MTNKFILLIISLFTLQLGWGQKLKTKDVPPRMITTLDKQFKGNKKARWEKVDSVYIVNFELDDQKGKAEFQEKGRLLSTEITVNKTEMPFSINHYLKKNYPDDDADVMIKMRDGEKNITFKIVIADDILVFDNDGRLVSKEKIPEEPAENNNDTDQSEN